MQELNLAEMEQVDGAGIAYWVGYAIGRLAQGIGDVDMAGALAQGA